MNYYKLKIDKKGDDYIRLDMSKAIRILCVIYGWKPEKILRKKQKSIQFWLDRASNSDKFTAEKMLIVEDIYYGRNSRKKILGIF